VCYDFGFGCLCGVRPSLWRHYFITLVSSSLIIELELVVRGNFSPLGKISRPLFRNQ
jgi:hypothetical protein